MDANVNIINWFEIPVTDSARAKKFYETLFNITMNETDMMGMKMTFFPEADRNGKVAGALVQSPNHIPAATGAVLYLNGNPDLADALSRVEAAGGKITMPKTHISADVGYMAFFFDTEGNHIGLHSNN